MQPALPELTGTVLDGRYRLDKLLGRGGMGAVFAGTHLAMGRKVAVKVVLPELATDGDVLARFRREAETTAALGHPNIVQVTDFGGGPGRPAFLVMEFLQGRSLREVLNTQGPLGVELVVPLALQLLIQFI